MVVYNSTFSVKLLAGKRFRVYAHMRTVCLDIPVLNANAVVNQTLTYISYNW